MDFTFGKCDEIYHVMIKEIKNMFIGLNKSNITYCTCERTNINDSIAR